MQNLLLNSILHINNILKISAHINKTKTKILIPQKALNHFPKIFLHRLSTVPKLAFQKRQLHTSCKTVIQITIKFNGMARFPH